MSDVLKGMLIGTSPCLSNITDINFFFIPTNTAIFSFKYVTHYRGYWIIPFCFVAISISHIINIKLTTIWSWIYYSWKIYELYEWVAATKDFQLILYCEECTKFGFQRGDDLCEIIRRKCRFLAKFKLWFVCFWILKRRVILEVSLSHKSQRNVVRSHSLFNV